MKIFLQKILVFISIIIIVITLITTVNRVIVNVYNPFKITDSKNILILGDSHTRYAINDKILKNTCNFSYKADSYFYTYVKLRHILKLNPQIDTVFISFSGHNIHKENEEAWLFNDSHLHERLKNYLPMLNFEDIIFIAKSNPSELCSSLFGQILFPMYFFTKKERYGGYKDVYGSELKEELQKLKLKQNKGESTFKEAEFEKLYLMKSINICKSYKKTIILINPPLHKSINQNQEVLYQFYEKYFSDVLFYDFSKIKMEDEHFRDLVHLSPLGSTYLSEMIKENNLFNRNNATTHNLVYEIIKK